MKARKNEFHTSIKKSRFPASLFGFYMGVLLLMSGIHTAVIVFMGYAHWNKVIQSIVPILYWGLVAVGLTIFTRKKMKDTYEEPMKKLCEAAKQVANGDFSVYVPTLHTSDKLDYLDVMILNFDKMVEELGSVEILKSDFVSNVSHEMKTPIAIIKNYAEMLKVDKISDEQRIEYAMSMEHAAMKLSGLISNILKLSKLENQRISTECEEYDVCRQLCECVLQFEEVWEKKGIEIEVDLQDSVRIYADENLMELVWNNLLSNAFKFTEVGGKVKLSQSSYENYVEVRVEDSGCGMSVECMNHIFDKFYQGDSSHSKEGNGLGLALVKRVLELMNATIEIYSQEGKGSSFIVTMPKTNINNGNGDEE